MANWVTKETYNVYFDSELIKLGFETLSALRSIVAVVPFISTNAHDKEETEALKLTSHIQSSCLCYVGT